MPSWLAVLIGVHAGAAALFLALASRSYQFVDEDGRPVPDPYAPSPAETGRSDAVNRPGDGAIAR